MNTHPGLRGLGCRVSLGFRIECVHGAYLNAGRRGPKKQNKIEFNGRNKNKTTKVLSVGFPGCRLD